MIISTSLSIWLGESLLYSQFLRVISDLILMFFFHVKCKGVLGAGSKSLFLHLNAKITGLQSQDSPSCCPNSPTNLIFSTTQLLQTRQSVFFSLVFLAGGKAIQRLWDEEGPTGGVKGQVIPQMLNL